MNKKLILIISSLIFLNLSNTYALNTYVGLKILDLKDDPSHTCAGES